MRTVVTRAEVEVGLLVLAVILAALVFSPLGTLILPGPHIRNENTTTPTTPPPPPPPRCHHKYGDLAFDVVNETTGERLEGIILLAPNSCNATKVQEMLAYYLNGTRLSYWVALRATANGEARFHDVYAGCPFSLYCAVFYDESGVVVPSNLTVSPTVRSDGTLLCRGCFIKVGGG